MDAALGPPDAMADSEGDLTPMMSQYFELTRRYDDALVLFQVGDFYELFCEAAEAAARICEVTLTAREDSTGRYPMAGVPIDNAEPYIEDLLDAGYRVAVADQVEDPDEVTGVVDRAVTRIVTPGTVTEDELLSGADNNFVAALAGDAGGGFGLALLDVSTGEFYATSLDDEPRVRDELGRFAPAELVVGPGVAPDRFADEAFVAEYDDAAFEHASARERVASYFGSVDALAADAEVRACGALLSYAEYTRGGEGHQRLEYLNHVTRYDPREYLQMDAVALRSLELFEQRSVHGAKGTALVDVLDETACALGRRELTDWLRRPLVDRDAIEARHDAVGELVGDPLTREELHEHLRNVYDVERLVSRVSRGRANARDLRSLKDTLDVVPEVRGLLADAEAPEMNGDGSGDVEVRVPTERRHVTGDRPAETGDGDARRYSAVGEGGQVDVDAAELTVAESAAIERFVDVLATLPGRRQQASRTGDRVDARRALRASLETGGAAIDLPRREPTPSELRCCLLVDVSGSVLDTVDRSVLLAFADRLHASARDARVFLFDTDLRDVTAQFDRAGGDPAGALRDAAVEWGGGTEIGGAFTSLRRDHPNAVDRRTAVVVVSDGLDVGDEDVLTDGVTWLADRAGALLWLNPLAVSSEFEPRSRGMATCEPYVDALFGFAQPADLAEAARQIERRGLTGPVGYEYDRRRNGSGGDGS